MTPRQYFMVAIAVLIFCAGLAAGLFIGYAHWHQESRPTTETFKSAVVQADKSVVLLKIPADPANVSKPPHTISKGAIETRRVQIVVKPKSVPIVLSTASGAGHDALNHFEDERGMVCACEPVHVDLSLIQDKTGSGVVASSPDGQVSASESYDVPIIDAVPVTSNALTLMGNTREHVYSASYARDFRLFGLPLKADAGVVSFKRQGSGRCWGRVPTYLLHLRTNK